MTFTPPVAEIDARKSRALLIGLVGLALCVLGFFLDRDHFFRAWLISFWLFLGISLGSLAAVMVQHLTGGQWGVFRRVFEAATRVLPLLAILGLPILLGTHTLYPWANGDFAAKDEILHHRELYLNTGFFVARYVIYFAVWIWFANVLNNLSRRQDSGDVSVNLKLQRLSGAGLVAYGIGVMFAGIDWIMVLNAHWYSTIFGFLTMGGQGLVLLTPAFWRNDIRDKRLCQPFELTATAGFRYWLCIAPERRNVPKIKRFREWLLRQVELSKLAAPLEAVA